MPDFKVSATSELLSFLLEKMKDKSRTTVKSYLSHGQVSINNSITTQFNTLLKPGDVVRVSKEKRTEVFRHPMLKIVYEDDHLIVVNKRNGLLSIATNKEQHKTAYYILSEYLKRQDPSNRIFIVHRLDRETSGLMIFAKSQQIQEAMQRAWSDIVEDRRYAAVIEGELPDDEGIISTYLTEDKNHKVWVTRVGEGAKAETNYRVLKSGKDYSLVELNLETGKKNQIRAHLQWMGTPIAGDKKYGAKSNPAGRVCLHAYKLKFRHPVGGETLDFSTDIPAAFDFFGK